MKKIFSILLLSLTLILPIGANAKSIDTKDITIDGEKVTVSWMYERWHEINGNKYYTDGFDLKTGWCLVKNRDDNGNWDPVHRTDWYYFDKTGKMLKNVIIDGYTIGPDGKGLYSEAKHNDLSKGQQGEFAKTITPIGSGWHSINGNWYYYNSDSMPLTNTITPDGYKVNENGIWIQ